jgi:hypothetical protein
MVEFGTQGSLGYWPPCDRQGEASISLDTPFTILNLDLPCFPLTLLLRRINQRNATRTALEERTVSFMYCPPTPSQVAKMGRLCPFGGTLYFTSPQAGAEGRRLTLLLSLFVWGCGKKQNNNNSNKSQQRPSWLWKGPSDWRIPVSFCPWKLLPSPLWGYASV